MTSCIPWLNLSTANPKSLTSWPYPERYGIPHLLPLQSIIPYPVLSLITSFRLRKLADSWEIGRRIQKTGVRIQHRIYTFTTASKASSPPPRAASPTIPEPTKKIAAGSGMVIDATTSAGATARASPAKVESVLPIVKMMKKNLFILDLRGWEGEVRSTIGIPFTQNPCISKYLTSLNAPLAWNPFDALYGKFHARNGRIRIYKFLILISACYAIQKNFGASLAADG